MDQVGGKRGKSGESKQSQPLIIGWKCNSQFVSEVLYRIAKEILIKITREIFRKYFQK